MGEEIDFDRSQSSDSHSFKFPGNLPYKATSISDALQDSSDSASVVNKGFSNRHQRTDYDKICLSLLCGLPNEQELALNVSTILSNEGNYMLHLEQTPKLITFLIAQAGVWPQDDEPLQMLHLESWNGLKGRNMRTFWKSSLDMQNEELLGILGYDLGEYNEEYSSLFNLEGSLGAHSVEGQRVSRVALILHNLSFEKNNVPVLVSSKTFVRFMLLCIHSSWGSLKQIAFDTLSNLACAIKLSIEKDVCSRLLFKSVMNGILSMDRYMNVRSLDILSQLCCYAENEDIIPPRIDFEVYQRMVSFLTVKDIMLLFYSLEALYALSDLGRYACDKIVSVHRCIGALVSLLTLEPSDYGPEAQINMKIVKTMVPAEFDSVQEDTEATTEETAVPPTPPRASTPLTVIAAAAAATTVATGEYVDAETFATNWLKATYELMPGKTVTRNELYSDYISFCSKAGRKDVANANVFTEYLKKTFPQCTIRKTESKGLYTFHHDGLHRKFPLVSSGATATNVTKCIAISPNFKVSTATPAVGRSTSSTSFNSILKTQLSSGPRSNVASSTVRAQSPVMINQQKIAPTPPGGPRAVAPVSASASSSTLIKSLLASKVQQRNLSPQVLPQNVSKMVIYTPGSSGLLGSTTTVVRCIRPGALHAVNIGGQLRSPLQTCLVSNNGRIITNASPRIIKSAAVLRPGVHGQVASLQSQLGSQGQVIITQSPVPSTQVQVANSQSSVANTQIQLVSSQPQLGNVQLQLANAQQQIQLQVQNPQPQVQVPNSQPQVQYQVANSQPQVQLQVPSSQPQVQLHAQNSQSQVQIQVPHSQPQSHLISSSQPQIQLCQAVNSQSQVQLQAVNPQVQLQASKSSSQMQLQLTNSQPQMQLQLANSQPQVQLQLANSQPQVQFQVATSQSSITNVQSLLASAQAQLASLQSKVTNVQHHLVSVQPQGSTQYVNVQQQAMNLPNQVVNMLQQSANVQNQVVNLVPQGASPQMINVQAPAERMDTEDPQTQLSSIAATEVQSDSVVLKQHQVVKQGLNVIPRINGLLRDVLMEEDEPFEVTSGLKTSPVTSIKPVQKPVPKGPDIKLSLSNGDCLFELKDDGNDPSVINTSVIKENPEASVTTLAKRIQADNILVANTELSSQALSEEQILSNQKSVFGSALSIEQPSVQVAKALSSPTSILKSVLSDLEPQAEAVQQQQLHKDICKRAPLLNGLLDKGKLPSPLNLPSNAVILNGKESSNLELVNTKMDSKSSQFVQLNQNFVIPVSSLNTILSTSQPNQSQLILMPVSSMSSVLPSTSMSSGILSTAAGNSGSTFITSSNTVPLSVPNPVVPSNTFLSNGSNVMQLCIGQTTLSGTAEVQSDQQGVVRLHIESPENSNHGSDLSSISDITRTLECASKALLKTNVDVKSQAATFSSISETVSSSSSVVTTASSPILSRTGQQFFVVTPSVNQSSLQSLQLQQPNIKFHFLHSNPKHDDSGDVISFSSLVNQSNPMNLPVVEASTLTSSSLKRPSSDSSTSQTIPIAKKPCIEPKTSLLAETLRMPTSVPCTFDLTNVSSKLVQETKPVYAKTSQSCNPELISKLNTPKIVTKPLQRVDSPSDNKGIRTYSGLSSSSSVNASISKLSPLPQKPSVGLEFLCEWKNCGMKFKNPGSVFLHASKAHTPFGSHDMVCLWEGCDSVKRKRLSLLTHIQDWHCNEMVLQSSALRRKQLAETGKTNIAPPQKPPPHPGYAPDAALLAIKRHALQYINPKELSEEKESVLTKSIRLTSALILRNLVTHSNLARSHVRKFEAELAYLAMSPVESARTLAQCLSQLYTHE